MGDSGGLTLDNLSVEYAGVVFSIAESPLEKGVVWAGTNDGQVQVSRDGGEHWINVTPNLPGLPPKGTVGCVEPSRFDPATCYIAVDLHQVDNRDPFLYKTTDYGASWELISSNIEKSPLSYAHVIRENPHRRGMLFAGTENALYVSFDDGGHWEPLQSKLPHAPVYWLTVQEHFHDLVVGTYGRGYYILDDLTPLEQVSDAVRDSAAHLFAPRPAYRFREVSQPDLAPLGSARGKNPPYGAMINYWLKEKVQVEKKEEGESEAEESLVGGPDQEQKHPVEVAIFDSAGEKIRTLYGKNERGFNRISWDLRFEPTQEVHLRTTPSGNPHVWEEKRFRGKNHRAVFYYGISTPKKGPLVPPGSYTVKLTVDGKELPTRILEVLKDPNSAATEADLEASSKLAVAIYKNINTVARMINQVEWTRKQVEEFRRMLKATKADQADFTAADALEKATREVEDRLMEPTLAEADAKSFRDSLELYLKFVWLLAEVSTGGGDVSGNADFAPTQPELEVYDLLSGRLSEVKGQFEELYGKTIPAFNESMSAKGYVHLMTIVEPEQPPPEPKPEEEEDDDWGS
jgi:hypothetical protein